MYDIEWITLKQVLEEYADYYIERAKENIINGGHHSSGNLENSMKKIIKIENNSFEVIIELADYYQYLENGTGPGHEPDPRAQYWPPIKAIRDWVTVKPILPEVITLADGTHPTQSQLPYVMQAIIHKYGTRATHVFSEAKKSVSEAFEDRIQEAICDDINRWINKELF